MKRRGNAIMMIAVALFVTGTHMAAAQETVIYGFSGSITGAADGSTPYDGLISDAKGNLYGTTSAGGASTAITTDGEGTVFELTPASGGGWTEKVLYSFGATATDGINPFAGLVFDAKGNLYGTTSLGGANGLGTAFELTPGTGGVWTEKVLYSFGATSTDASEPKRGSLIFDAKGNLYGTTRLGGPNSLSNGGGLETGGTVYELTPGTGGVWTEKVLYNFGATSTDAANPVGGLAMDATGNLYGTTLYGGANNYGTVFELAAASGGAWTETILHSFNLNGTDGTLPYASLIFDAQGNLYGTTYGGGSNPSFGGSGTVFELTPGAGGMWNEQILHSFTPFTTDGDYPYGSLVFDAAGNLYGTTSSRLYGYGIVFQLTPAAGGWKENILHFFGGNPDGQGPLGGVIFDAAGNLYGTTSTGGPNGLGLAGTVFEIASVTAASPQFSPAGGAYAVVQTVTITDSTSNATIYYTTDGSTPTASSMKYTEPIDVSESETIKAIAVATGLPQSQVATANYQIGGTAALPEFSPVAGFYTLAQSVTLTDAAPGATIYYTTNGTTPTTSSSQYTGAISVLATETIEAIAVAAGYTDSPVASATYTITPAGAPQEDVLYSFGATSTDGGVPYAGLIFDTKGNLYGTTEYGGPNEVKQGDATVTGGTVFELTPATGGGWTEKVLYNFGATSTDGANPIGGLAIDANGNLYGTTSSGGISATGMVFELTPAANGTWTEKVLHNFNYVTNDGTAPHAGLIFDAAGNLYGTTSGGGANSSASVDPGGTVFELSPAAGGAWTEQLLYSFNYLNKADGYYPTAGLIFDTKGNLYGTTSDGGSGQDSQGGGTVFELSPIAGGAGWTEKVLFSFGGGSTITGYKPIGGLVLDSGGNLYGTAYSGGPNGFGLDGTVFEVMPSSGGTWTEKDIYNLGGNETDGINSEAGLLIDAKDNLYGTTAGGGANGFGTVFELSTSTGAEQVLHSFDLNGTDGASPYGGLLFDATGNLYGTTGYGGAHGGSDTGITGGTVFEIVSATTTQEPEFSPGTGAYTSTQSVTITDTTADATIYYTTNGTPPTTASTKYTGAISVSATETIEAIAVASGYAQSAVASATYTIEPVAASPVFTPGAGTYASAQSVTITDATSNATIYYTTNGTTPTTSSPKYTAAITVSSTETIEAIAVASGYANSAVSSATYTITPPPPPPTPLRFIPVTPCRIADTRNPTGPFGGPELTANSTREFDIPQSACGYSLDQPLPIRSMSP